jgi:hypothetical protein
VTSIESRRTGAATGGESEAGALPPAVEPPEGGVSPTLM